MGALVPKALEAENAKLKKMLAEHMLDVARLTSNRGLFRGAGHDDLLFAEPLVLHGSSSFIHSEVKNSSSQRPGSRTLLHKAVRRIHCANPVR